MDVGRDHPGLPPRPDIRTADAIDELWQLAERIRVILNEADPLHAVSNSHHEPYLGCVTARAEVFQQHSLTVTNQPELATVRCTGLEKASGNELIGERDNVIGRNAAHAHVIRFSAI